MNALVRRPRLTFVCGAVAIYVACQSVAASRAFAAHPLPLGAAVVFDGTVTLGALFWALNLRGGRGRWASLVPVAAFGLLRALTLVGHGRLDAGVLTTFAVVAEAALVAFIVARVVAARRAHSAGGRPLGLKEALSHAARELFGATPVASLLASELAVLAYALAPPRYRETRPRARSFTGHLASGYGGLLAALMLVALTESLVAHVVVAQLWGARAAWVLAALGAYSLLWLFGDYRALGLRPTLLTGDMITFRVGARWCAEIARGDVRLARRYEPADAARAGFRKVVAFGEPNLTLELARPVTLAGPFGRRALATSLGVAFDDPGAFVTALAAGPPAA